MGFSPSRRFLFLPAWLWLLFPPLLVLLAYLLGRPAGLAEPGERAEILSPTVVVARDNDSFRFVPWDNPQHITPLWALTCTITSNIEMNWNLGLGDGGGFGFWKQSGRWRYELAAHRFDKEWKSGEPLMLPADDMNRLRPLVIDELNRNSPNERRGDRLAKLLDQGIERTSYVCVQNAVILLAWVSVVIACLSFVMMFIKPRRCAESPETCPLRE
jgi:hypothetical protein